ncbi:hypothetical protein KIPB_010660 [Kipferlia bialata]|uniref:Brix domain-containing protein n=1 Tax=Kipferlia bialata TaxID=797122 RepID=A0A9K3D6V6_9EUKA|nr:hypothetical protein KIPB_010660 [Kipferlia bialata]|eukprot:g10660.t1
MGGHRRRKKRTHVVDESEKKEPVSFIFSRGQVGKGAQYLVGDLRNVMQPNANTALKVKKSNKLRDFIAIAGPLGVTHLMVLGSSGQQTTLRIIRMPQGPTVTFTLDRYCTAAEVCSMINGTPASDGAKRHPPLLILAGFNNTGTAQKKESVAADGEEGEGEGEGEAAKEGAASGKDQSRQLQMLRLVATTLKHMLPPFDPATTSLSSLRRALLFQHRGDGVIDLREYAVTLTDTSVSSELISDLTKKKVPDLGGYETISSAFEGFDGANSVGGMQGEAGHIEKDRVKLTECGPRLRMRVLKVEGGITSGPVLYHRLSQYSAAQVAGLEIKARESKRRLENEARRNVVRVAVRRKKEAERADKKRLREQMKSDERTLTHYQHEDTLHRMERKNQQMITTEEAELSDDQ